MVLGRLANGAVGVLDRPLLRGILGTVATVLYSARTGQRSRVRWRRGLWEHRSAAGTIPWPTPTWLTPELLARQLADSFGHWPLPGEGDVVVDVGAGFGAEVLPLSHRVGASGRVIAIEASPASVTRLERLIEANRLTNVTVLPVAASDRSGTVTISQGDVEELNTIVDARSGVDVEAVTLERVLAPYRRIDWLKMNIEGGERLALIGLKVTAPRVRRIVVCCHDFRASEGAPEAMRTTPFVREWLSDQGFIVEARDDRRPHIRDQLWGTRVPGDVEPASE